MVWAIHRQARVGGFRDHLSGVKPAPHLLLNWLGSGAMQGKGGGTLATHRQVSPTMKSRMAPTSSLFQKSLKYKDAIFISPQPSGS